VIAPCPGGARGRPRQIENLKKTKDKIVIDYRNFDVIPKIDQILK
jgi:hypothetical protein